jgi:hypothetical protein
MMFSFLFYSCQYSPAVSRSLMFTFNVLFPNYLLYNMFLNITRSRFWNGICLFKEIVQLVNMAKYFPKISTLLHDKI